MSKESPRIIACGHKHVCVKTGNSFPALLVQFPSMVMFRCDGESTQECDSAVKKQHCFWRTKRDFLLLNRSLQKYDPTKSFPKKAFSKLCNNAMESGPWIRSDGDFSECSELLQSLLSDSGDMKNRLNDSNNDNFFFDPRLKKSLLVVDSFLCEMYNIYTLGVARCNSNDDSVVDDDSSNTSLQGIVNAWTIFCRGQDTDGLIIPDFHNIPCSTSHDEVPVVPNRIETNAARLGQYFASDENAKDVVDTALHLAGKPDSSDKRCVFVEPSCGDGRIILELLKTRSHLLDDAIIVGCDINSSAIQRSIENIDRFTMPSNFNAKPTFRCCNYLDASCQDLMIPKDNDHVTVVLGGPPYTPKDLPEKFILHSIHELQASIVVFILPARCQKDAPRIQGILNRHISIGGGWQFANRDLANITFDFEGSRIMQPSILQYWYKDPE